MSKFQKDQWNKIHHRAPRNGNRVCVRLVGQGVPHRLPREEADKLVREHDAEYCTQRFFKDWGKQNDSDSKVDRARAS